MTITISRSKEGWEATADSYKGGRVGYVAETLPELASVLNKNARVLYDVAAMQPTLAAAKNLRRIADDLQAAADAAAN